MEVQHLGLKYVILVTPRSMIFLFKITIYSVEIQDIVISYSFIYLFIICLNDIIICLHHVSPNAVCFIAFATQINSWYTCLHCSRGSVPEGIRRKGIYLFLRCFLALVESYIGTRIC